MFTGIVQEVGRLIGRQSRQQGMEFEFSCRTLHTTLRPGDSVSCNGACLTVTRLKPEGFTVDAVPETLARTNLGTLSVSERINLEPAVTPGTPLGGHYVLGHVDGLARVEVVRDLADGSREMELTLPEQLMKYCVPKGSICLNGASLTLARVGRRSISVALIPFTLEHTNLGEAAAGRELNFEADILGKYVERLLLAHLGKTGEGLSAGDLEKWGYAVQ